MNLVNKTMSGLKNLKSIEIFFSLIMIIYLISNMSTPYNLAPYINNIYTYGSIIALIVLLVLHSNLFVALLFAVTSLVFIYKSRLVDHNIMKPSEINKNKAMQEFHANNINSTLEEEIIKKMAKKPDNIPSSENYLPVLCSSHGASEL